MASAIVYKITIKKTQVSADLTGVPVRIVIRDDAIVGAVCRADGFDVIFKTAAEATLAFQRRSFAVASSEATGVFIVFCNISSTVDTIIYLWAGDASASDTSSEGWDANTIGLYTLHETPTGTEGDFKDWTSNNNDSTNTSYQPTHTVGKLDGVARFSGSYQYVEIGTGLAVGGTALTIEGWFSVSAYVTDKAFLCQRQERWQIICSDYDGHIQFCLWSSDSQYNYMPTEVWPLDEWFHFVLTYDGQHVIFYKDGDVFQSFDCTYSIDTDTVTTRIGADLWSGFYSGKQTEIGIHNTARSAAWVHWRYHNTVVDNGQLTLEVPAVAGVGGGSGSLVGGGLVS
ncbi:LamG domain-containing protein [Candidatus Pacearchaeota archaeon]|jgi:hypothetical protein|nr:LamG domain-containing protein [Candidatus Pacearchaeota archaeon]